METQLNGLSNGHGLGAGSFSAPSARGPVKIAYVVSDRQGKSYWTRIGAAFTNRDGSLTIRLDAVPVTGTLQLRDWTPRDAGERPESDAKSDAYAPGFGAPPTTDIPF